MMQNKAGKVWERFTIIYFILICTTSCVQSTGSKMDSNQKMTLEKHQNEIIELESNLIQAYLKNDIAVLQDLYHDDLIFNSPDGRVLKKQDDIESLKSGTLKILEYKPENYIININENTAYVSVSIHLKAQIIGGEFERDFLFMRVWQQFEDEWKLTAISGFLKPG